MKLWLTLAALCASTAATPTAAQAEDSLGLQSRAEPKGSFIPITAPRDNLYMNITEREEQSILKFLERQKNSTVPGDMEFDYWRMWLLAPNKTEATAYLDGKGKKPKRYARVIGESDCYSREYMVGPLPICTKTKVVPLDYANGGNATRERPVCNSDWEDDWEDEDDGSDDEDDLRASRVPGYRNMTNPLGGPSPPPRDHLTPPTKRTTKRDMAKKEMGKRALQRRDPLVPYSEEQTWDGTELSHDEMPPPVAILPGGARHEFDPKQNYVSWMGFTFYVSTGLSGIALHDVRFNGERVAYEFAMQEALAHYSGPGEYQNTWGSYLDVQIDFTGYNLIPGFDCPSYATYTHAFCLFEFPKDYPLSRHSSGEYYHATRNTAFMLRSISTIGNYDYQTTYEFHYDGTIQIMVRASGYIQGDDDVESEDADEYGFRIRKDLSGSMHDHVLNFKADLDIKGNKNSLLKTEFVPNSQTYSWSGGKPYNNMKVDRSFITNENDGKINWAANSAAAYAVVNKDKPNEFGEYPGFRIFPSLGSTIHLTVENSSMFGNAINWASHQLYALQRKDSEPVSSHPEGTWDEGEPRVDFNDFFDGDSLDQEDIVLYFNLGMHHMPDTYDLPVTVFQGAQSGITLRPQNYQRNNPATAARHQIHIARKDNESVVETYGVQDLSGSYDLSKANMPYIPLPEWEPWEEGDWEEEDGDWDEDEDDEN